MREFIFYLKQLHFSVNPVNQGQVNDPIEEEPPKLVYIIKDMVNSIIKSDEKTEKFNKIPEIENILVVKAITT